MALGARVSENFHLSLETVQKIATETYPERELSQSEIVDLASRLNGCLWWYEVDKKFYSEPTFKQLCTQIHKLHKALKVLKHALPSPEQNSLRNYLIELGEVYAETRGSHPNLASKEAAPTKYHYRYRSDERLDEMISSVSQVLEWMNNTPAKMKKPANWWILPEMLKRGYGSNLPIDAHRGGGGLRTNLIGYLLPEAYEKVFKTRYGVSRSPGPGVRFVEAVLRHAGISNDNKPFSVETVISYRQNYRRRTGRTAASSSASLSDKEPKK
jgi:hypothetical protein